MSTSSIERMQYITAEWTTEAGAVEVTANLTPCALEVEHSGAIFLIYLDAKTDL
jgi:hypothetical protein